VPSSLTSSMAGWTLSFIIYFLIVAVGSYMLQSHNTKAIKYTASKKTPLVVTLVKREEKKEKTVKKSTTIKKSEPSPREKIVKVEKSEPKPDFKKLFGKIDLDKLPEERQEKSRKQPTPKKPKETIEEQKAKRAVDELELKQQENFVVTQNDGVHDEFIGEIQDILYSKWEQTIGKSPGTKAVVVIGVDRAGNFSYKIERLSYNNAFNARLRNFLENMKFEKFPPAKTKEIFYFKTTIGDIQAKD